MSRFRIIVNPTTIAELSPNLEYSLSSLLYRIFKENGLYFHDYRDKRGRPLYRPFTFSKPQYWKYCMEHNRLFLSGNMMFWFSSPDHSITSLMREHLSKATTLRIQEYEFRVVDLSEIRAAPRLSNEVQLETISPVYMVKRIDRGNRITPFPYDEMYSKILVEKLMRKYCQLGKIEYPYSSDLKATITKVMGKHQIWIHRNLHICYDISVSLRGPPQLLRFAYDAGLGQKNSLGFGMVRMKDVQYSDATERSASVSIMGEDRGVSSLNA